MKNPLSLGLNFDNPDNALFNAFITCFLVDLDFILDAVPSSLLRRFVIEFLSVFQLTVTVINDVSFDFVFCISRIMKSLTYITTI